jgi:type IV secretory pathway component VirB8
MISRENQKEFESLGTDMVRVRVLTSVWSESKTKEAREWISREDSRIARSAKNAAWAAAIAAIISAVAAVIAVVLSLR